MRSRSMAWRPGGYLLVTAHRAGNVDDPARSPLLVELLECAARDGRSFRFIRARVRGSRRPACSTAWRRRRRLEAHAAARLPRLPRAGEARSRDPHRLRGVQKEAYLLGTPCVTLRDTTEWVETVEQGWNVLVDLDRDAALAALERERPPGERPELYGGGSAAERICDVLDAYTPAG